MSVRARLGSSVDGVMMEMNGVTEEGERALEECAGYCGLLQTSLDSLAESGLGWCDKARNLTEHEAQERLELIRETDVAMQDLLKVSLVLSHCPHLQAFAFDHLSTCVMYWPKCSNGHGDFVCVCSRTFGTDSDTLLALYNFLQSCIYTF